ncbi:MAG TPA: hypothetical protein VFY66_17800 [Anaerolineales bacterium]|nr:hypothetical protein [Anaerolineales bacterium]
MKHINRLILVTLIFAGLLLSACGAQTTAPEKVVPSKLEPIEGTDLSKVILTEKAAERIGVETVAASGSEVPYAAVIYDIEGNTWIYTNPEPLTFVREQIMIDRIEGDTAFLAESLPGELKVVTVGVAEIYGTETGVSK